ncbi:MAG: type II toxin-antitoxin system HicB family antitoxin [Patescibacteria group bacterium]
MKLKLQQFIENKLTKAHYEFDESVGQWCGSVQGVPGVYAQAESVEKVREELAEILEEWILFSLRDNQKIKGFNLNSILGPKIYA